MHAVPSSSPQNVSATSLSSTAIQVTWEEIPQTNRNGEIIIHEVLYDSRGAFYPITSGTENTTDFSLLLMDLDPFTEYAISVRAYTSAGLALTATLPLESTLQDGKRIYFYFYVIRSCCTRMQLVCYNITHFSEHSDTDNR